jgi:hypothetical protein
MDPLQPVPHVNLMMDTFIANSNVEEYASPLKVIPTLCIFAHFQKKSSVAAYALSFAHSSSQARPTPHPYSKKWSSNDCVDSVSQTSLPSPHPLPSMSPLTPDDSLIPLPHPLLHPPPCLRPKLSQPHLPHSPHLHLPRRGLRASHLRMTWHLVLLMLIQYSRHMLMSSLRARAHCSAQD